jgi:hypothetical protein
MKLRKQTRLKVLITALSTGLFLLFLGLVHAHPQIEAEAGAVPQPEPTPDYDRIFAPPAGAASATPAVVATPRPHTRTRGS